MTCTCNNNLNIFLLYYSKVIINNLANIHDYIATQFLVLNIDHRFFLWVYWALLAMDNQKFPNWK